MKPDKTIPVDVSRCAFVLRTALCGVLVLLLGGCASNSYKKADAASASQQKTAFEISAENRAIDAAIAALDDLVNKPNGDLKPQFEHFSSAVDNLVACSKRAESAAYDATKKSQDYFQTWDKQAADIRYQAVRDQSVSRKAQVAAEFNTVNQRYRENQGVVQPLIVYLQDIRTALNSDLTVGGLQSVKTLAANAQENARKVQSALAQLSDDWSASSVRMSSLVMQDNQAKGGVGDSVQSAQQRAESSQ